MDFIKIGYQPTVSASDTLPTTGPSILPPRTSGNNIPTPTSKHEVNININLNTDTLDVDLDAFAQKLSTVIDTAMFRSREL